MSSPEMHEVLRMLPATAPGSDGVTTRTVKMLDECFPKELLTAANDSFQFAWTVLDWKLWKGIV